MHLPDVFAPRWDLTLCSTNKTTLPTSSTAPNYELPKHAVSRLFLDECGPSRLELWRNASVYDGPHYVKPSDDETQKSDDVGNRVKHHLNLMNDTNDLYERVVNGGR